jgi:hypothetical protein
MRSAGPRTRLGCALLAAGLCTLGLPARALARQALDEGAGPSRPFVPTFVGLRFDAEPAPSTIAPEAAAPAVAQTSAPAPVVFAYSDGYRKRNTIHRIASYTTLPLFGAEAYLGQKLFNDPAGATTNLRHLHGTIAIAITALFGVNSVTGVWNLIEARKDPHGTTLRTIHGVLMLVAEGGFMATALDHPNGRTAAGSAIYTDKANQHLALAYASLSVATVGYLIMLFR